jgi:hypothetical protein
VAVAAAPPQQTLQQLMQMIAGCTLQQPAAVREAAAAAVDGMPGVAAAATRAAITAAATAMAAAHRRVCRTGMAYSSSSLAVLAAVLLSMGCGWGAVVHQWAPAGCIPPAATAAGARATAVGLVCSSSSRLGWVQAHGAFLSLLPGAARSSSSSGARGVMAMLRLLGALSMGAG